MKLRIMRIGQFGLALYLAASLPLLAADQRDPARLVSDTAGQILDALQARESEFRNQPKLVEDLVRNDLLPVLDLNYSARLILGREGRNASDQQVEAFASAMSNVLIERYARGLLEYRNREQLEVLPVRGELNERMTRVRTRIRMDNGNHIPVDYVFHKTADGWKAFDVIVEGISYVTTYRNQIMPEVQASGIDAVTARLGRGELMLNKE
jgi:phospholipid transport system substrate-binding protein